MELLFSKAHSMFTTKMMATKACKMIALFLKSIKSYMIPDTVGPQKLPRANEEVKRPETTACTWNNVKARIKGNLSQDLGWCFQHLHAFREPSFNCCYLSRTETSYQKG